MNTHTVTQLGFIVLPIAVAGAVVWAGKSKPLTLTIILWMSLAAALGLSGILGHFKQTPPPIALFLVSGFIGTILLGRSDWVRHLIALPLGWLVGFQAFRILVELLIHQSSTIGLAPVQMTWSGYNFDIVTGVSALLLAPLARSAPRWLIMLWNCLGLTLLTVVVVIAAVSFPTRFQRLRPDNTWVAAFPYVWLPAVLVLAALLGHIVVFRRLATARR